jgi:O-antigen/teichoic acid export membrane protein
VSRTRKAGIIATFSYLQTGLALVSGIVLVPFILRRVGVDSYGLWLACGDLLAYSAMADLGVLSVLPWLVAEKDGQRDRQGIRDLISNGVAAAFVIGLLYFLVAVLLWLFATRIIHITNEQRAVLTGPLLLVVLGTAVAFPLRTFLTILFGLQDVAFTGLLRVGQWALNIGIIVLMLIKGYGLYSLALAVVLPPLLVSLLALIRLRLREPDLLSGWHSPSFSLIYYIIREGFGGWIAGFGWRMIAASNSIIIASVGSPEMVVVYACTAKLGDVLMQLSWQLSDSGLVGLAQLFGEGNRKRVREVILTMLRILLISAGGVAAIVLALNGSFVSLWIGSDKFAGIATNILLAASVLCLSLTHGLIVPVSVLGQRIQVGSVTLLQGIVNLALAVSLARLMGLKGIALASVCSSLIITLPLGLRLLERVTQLSFADVANAVLWPWSWRIVGLLTVSALIGIWMPHESVILLFGAAPGLGLIYLWHMRPLYVDLPLPLSVKPWLAKLRLIPQQ